MTRFFTSTPRHSEYRTNMEQLEAEGTAESSKVQCTSNGKTYSTISNLLRHIKDKKLNYQCSICDSRFGQKGQLIRHMQIRHLGIKKYVCPHCKEKFITKANMNRHVILAHVKNMDSSYKCEVCGSNYVTKKYLHRHIVQRHRSNFSNTIDTTENIKREVCEDNQHISSFDVSEKVENKHSIFKPNVLTVKKVCENSIKYYVCDICNSRFKKFHMLTRHIERHGKSYACPMCASSFNTLLNLRRHLRNIHSLKCKSNVSLDLLKAVHEENSDLMVNTSEERIQVIKKNSNSNIQQTKKEEVLDVSVDETNATVGLSMPLLDEETGNENISSNSGLRESVGDNTRNKQLEFKLNCTNNCINGNENLSSNDNIHKNIRNKHIKLKLECSNNGMHTTFTKDTLISHVIVPLQNNIEHSKKSEAVAQYANEINLLDYKSPNYIIDDDMYSDLKLFETIPINSLEFEPQHKTKIDTESYESNYGFNGSRDFIKTSIIPDIKKADSLSKEKPNENELFNDIESDANNVHFSTNISDISVELIDSVMDLSGPKKYTSSSDAINENLTVLTISDDEPNLKKSLKCIKNADDDLQDFVDRMLILPPKKCIDSEIEISDIILSGSENNSSTDYSAFNKYSNLETFHDIRKVTNNTGNEITNCFGIEFNNNNENIDIIVNPSDVLHSKPKNLVSEINQSATIDHEASVSSKIVNISENNLDSSPSKAEQILSNICRVTKESDTKIKSIRKCKVKLPTNYRFNCVFCGEEFSKMVSLRNHSDNCALSNYTNKTNFSNLYACK